MPRTRWPAARLARAAFLCGKGHTSERVAADALIDSTGHAVRQNLAKVGLVASECAETDALVAVPSETLAELSRMRRKPGETVEGMLRRLLGILAADPTLLANVLDDDGDCATQHLGGRRAFRVNMLPVNEAISR